MSKIRKSLTGIAILIVLGVGVLVTHAATSRSDGISSPNQEAAVKYAYAHAMETEQHMVVPPGIKTLVSRRDYKSILHPPRAMLDAMTADGQRAIDRYFTGLDKVTVEGDLALARHNEVTGASIGGGVYDIKYSSVTASGDQASVHAIYIIWLRGPASNHLPLTYDRPSGKQDSHCTLALKRGHWYVERESESIIPGTGP